MQPEDYAGMSLDQLKVEREKIQTRKRENSEVLGFLESKFGQQWLARKQKDREDVRDRYAKIKVDKDAELIVRELIATQNFESFIFADLQRLETAKKVAETLDNELAKCNSAIRVKGSALKQ